MTATTKIFRTSTIVQIQVSVEGFSAKAVLTRFVGDRAWTVRGTDHYGSYSIDMHDGNKKQFNRSTALRLAEQFIRTGREFL